MQIILENIGKRYNFEWIFRNVNHKFEQNEHTVILGSNGAGKSTLLQIILSNIIPSEGKISYSNDGNNVETDKITGKISFSAPYLELYEELDLKELIHLQEKFKPYIEGLENNDIINILGFERSKNKQVKYYSSGMKQRVKLALAILADTPVLLLDEPVSNLDKEGIAWYRELVGKYNKERIVVVCSNLKEEEYWFCKKKLEIEKLK